MSPQSKDKAVRDRHEGMAQPRIRHATKEDSQHVADLMVRLKRLNSEFDPLFMVVEDARERALDYVSASLDSPKVLLLVATQEAKVTGFLRAEIRERVFYKPHLEGHITDMYVLPEFRRKQLGHDILERCSSELAKMGAEIISADLPSRNEIGVHFYMKRGYRRLTETLTHLPQ